MSDCAFFTNTEIFSGVVVRLLQEAAAGVLVAGLLYVVCRAYPLFAEKAAARWRGLATRAVPFVVASMLLPLLLRLALLPWVPPPEPGLHDEFSHLLVADTLNEGRLANPAHPLWRHLETIYVVQQPNYASIYPVGKGAIMAVGQALTGEPWSGVLLAVALMCGATSWMLFGCLPVGWAAAGSLLASIHYGLAWQNVNTYWGGAFCAFGGALLFGALSRLWKGPSRWMGFVAGLGWSIVWLIRPFESLLLFVVVWGFMAAFLRRGSDRWIRWRGTVALLLLLQVLGGVVSAVHNRAVTGSYTKLPYQLSREAYGVPQSFLWQEPVDPPEFRFAEAEGMYWWQREVKGRADGNPLGRLSAAASEVWEFFVSPWYSLPFLLVVFLWRDRCVAASLGIIGCALGAAALFPFFSSQYFMAYFCVFVFLSYRGTMLLWHWSFRGRAVGRFAVVFLMTGGLMMGLRLAPLKEILRIDPPREHSLNPRNRLRERLVGLGGKHVVFVRYGPGHGLHQEWVYNRADVDAAAIVWCRALGPAEDAKVARYYEDRQMWIVEVAEDAATLYRYLPEGETAETEMWVFGGRL